LNFFVEGQISTKFPAGPSNFSLELQVKFHFGPDHETPHCINKSWNPQHSGTSNDCLSWLICFLELFLPTFLSVVPQVQAQHARCLPENILNAARMLSVAVLNKFLLYAIIKNSDEIIWAWDEVGAEVGNDEERETRSSCFLLVLVPLLLPKERCQVNGLPSWISVQAKAVASGKLEYLQSIVTQRKDRAFFLYLQLQILPVSQFVSCKQGKTVSFLSLSAIS
jgi:hypothetical protein